MTVPDREENGKDNEAIEDVTDEGDVPPSTEQEDLPPSTKAARRPAAAEAEVPTADVELKNGDKGLNSQEERMVDPMEVVETSDKPESVSETKMPPVAAVGIQPAVTEEPMVTGEPAAVESMELGGETTGQWPTLPLSDEHLQQLESVLSSDEGLKMLEESGASELGLDDSLIQVR